MENNKNKMTKKQEEICQDPECGHDKLKHGRVRVLGKKYPRGECFVDGCSCKKFVAKVSEKPKVSVKTKSKLLKPKKEGTSLSEKEIDFYGGCYNKEDVKKFIKKETKLIQLWMREKITAKEFWERRRKLAGDKLNGN